MQEEVIVGKRSVERGGVRVHKRVHEREEVVEQPAWHEEVEVERVAVGQFVDVIPEPREEGDTLIIPILEEVLVVETRLVVKEEIRITRRRSEDTQQLRATLRTEEAIVEHIDETRESSNLTTRTRREPDLFKQSFSRVNAPMARNLPKCAAVRVGRR